MIIYVWLALTSFSFVSWCEVFKGGFRELLGCSGYYCYVPCVLCWWLVEVGGTRIPLSVLGCSLPEGNGISPVETDTFATWLSLISPNCLFFFNGYWVMVRGYDLLDSWTYLWDEGFCSSVLEGFENLVSVFWA